MNSVPWKRGLKVKDRWGHWWVVKSLRYFPWSGVRAHLSRVRADAFGHISSNTFDIVEHRP
jgi:hypothetical protein